MTGITKVEYEGVKAANKTLRAANKKLNEELAEAYRNLAAANDSCKAATEKRDRVTQSFAGYRADTNALKIRLFDKYMDGEG